MNTPSTEFSTPAYLRDSTMTGPPESEAEAAGYPALSHAESRAILRQHLPHLSEQDWNTIARGFQTSNASGDGTGLRVEMVKANLPAIFPGELSSASGLWAHRSVHAHQARGMFYTTKLKTMAENCASPARSNHAR